MNAKSRSNALLNILKANGLLLDYDGLLVDTESLYLATWCMVLDKEGQNICASSHRGRHESEVFELVKNHINPMLKLRSLEQVSLYRKVMFHQLATKSGFVPMAGWLTFLVRFFEVKRMFVVSNSTLDAVNWGLETAGVKQYFNGVIGFDGCGLRKPDPYLYNQAVQLLAIPRPEIVAFEDSEAGLLAARAAGIYAICVSDNEGTWDFCSRMSIPFFRSAVELLDGFRFAIKI